jgi:hypothetical protein
MALQLTRDNVLARFGGYRSGATSLIHGASAMLKHELHPAVRTGAISLSAFTFGVIQGKYQPDGGCTLAGLPVDMLSGLVFHTVSLFGFARNYSSLLHAFGDGALATFLATTGYRVGERWGKGKQGFLPAMYHSFKGEKAGLMGEDKPVSGGSSIADNELKNLVRGE